MKNLKLLKYALVAMCMVMQFSCSKDEEAGDVYVYFPENEMNLDEDATEAINIPIQVYSEGNLKDNLWVSYTIEGEGTDRVIDQSGGIVSFEKGYDSYIGYITLEAVDNELGDGDAELTILLSSADQNINIGLSSNNDNNTILIRVVDDECTDQIDVFPGTLLNNATYGSADLNLSASLNGNVLTLNGDILGYSPVNATLDITLTPSSDGAVDGTVTFDGAVVGTDDSGYTYFVYQNGEGTYNACLGEIRFSIYVYYIFETDSDYTYWYASDSVITIP